MKAAEQQQIVDLLNRQEEALAWPDKGGDYSDGYKAGWTAAINAVRSYLEGSGLIPHS